MAGLLFVGFVCNLLVRRVTTPAGAPGAPAGVVTVAPAGAAGARPSADWPALLFRWAWVGIPLAWGVSQTVLSSLALFR